LKKVSSLIPAPDSVDFASQNLLCSFGKNSQATDAYVYFAFTRGVVLSALEIVHRVMRVWWQSERSYCCCVVGNWSAIILPTTLA